MKFKKGEWAIALKERNPSMFWPNRKFQIDSIQQAPRSVTECKSGLWIFGKDETGMYVNYNYDWCEPYDYYKNFKTIKEYLEIE